MLAILGLFCLINGLMMTYEFLRICKLCFKRLFLSTSHKQRVARKAHLCLEVQDVIKKVKLEREIDNNVSPESAYEQLGLQALVKVSDSRRNFFHRML